MQSAEQIETQIKHIISFTNKFQLLKTDPNTTVINSNTHAYLIKNMAVSLQESKDLSSILDTLSMHQCLNQKYLLTLLYYEVYKGLDGSQYIKAIYEYGNLTLQQEIQNRLTLGTPFEEDQLWSIFVMTVKALSHLEESGIVYGVLGTDKIMVNETVRLLDPSATATDPLLISEGRLYSPQILDDQEEINMFKSDIYVLALIIIECGLLVDLSKQVEPDLQKYLNQFRKQYSPQLFQLLQSMLNVEPDSRPSFLELKNYLTQQMDLNATQCNQLATPCFTDEEDMPSANCCLRQEQQQVNDLLYESILGESITQSEIEMKKIQSSDLFKAKLKYLQTNHETQLYHSVARNINSAKKTISPLSTNNNSYTDIQICPRSQKSKTKQNNKQNEINNDTTIMLKKSHYYRNSDNSQKASLNTRLGKHNYSKSTGYFNHIDNYESTFNDGSQQNRRRSDLEYETIKSKNKQKTKQIKRRLVKKIQENQQIREQQEEEENSMLNMFQSNCQFDTTKKEQIFVKNFESCRVSQEFEFPTHRSIISSSNSKLFTDPQLLKAIHEDLARISSTKNSALQSPSNRRMWYQ